MYGCLDIIQESLVVVGWRRARLLTTVDQYGTLSGLISFPKHFIFYQRGLETPRYSLVLVAQVSKRIWEAAIYFCNASIDCLSVASLAAVVENYRVLRQWI